MKVLAWARTKTERKTLRKHKTPQFKLSVARKLLRRSLERPKLKKKFGAIKTLKKSLTLLTSLLTLSTTVLNLILTSRI